ncbi:hypothetical protein KIN20_013882 [Parelaphostrongylus tenuis]|uniref:Uncharacterized protein n=1 Tax=Parelaphostrongylus tenuis TaxID=148309 RepID=A0AAD5MYR0_PARTN|nr:hypothetical protein KIN20_013882 [Parelaphostrongylus tenuis]
MPGHVARRARMDDGRLTSSLSHTTPRSFSWTRTPRPPTTTVNARFSRSQSVTRARTSTEEDEEKKEMAEAAYREWLKRKAAEPHTPRASPTREQICLHLKEDARHRVYNNWFHSRRFTSSPKSNGETTPTSEAVCWTPSY